MSNPTLLVLRWNTTTQRFAHGEVMPIDEAFATLNAVYALRGFRDDVISWATPGARLELSSEIPKSIEKLPGGGIHLHCGPLTVAQEVSRPRGGTSWSLVARWRSDLERWEQVK